ncbi:unnamed protein product [Strongylus vulgaris]|uniref:Uncharacterized protein n=1 Tax=Strongylus vulgaris TaxID=40348 RepID=A0A3P7KIB8_STRVU|nr:unnamed protein product [Strongylus vulgaris]
MVELLTLLLSVFGWTFYMSLCAKQKELKSEGRGMPISTRIAGDSWTKKSEPVSPATSLSNTTENTRPLKKPLSWERRKRFSRDENEKKSEGTTEKKASDEKTEGKSSKKEQKEKEGKPNKEENKAIKVEEKSKKAPEAEKPIKTDRTIGEKTEQMDLKPTASATKLKDGASSREAKLPGETLALLAAAEQMALENKGDYDNFGPPEAK